MAVRPVWIYLFLALCAPQAVVANNPVNSDWNALPGNAVDLGINSAAQAYRVDTKGNIWHWLAEQQRWGYMTSGFARIAAAEGNRPWAVNAKGIVYRYNGLWWENKGSGVADVAANTRGDVYIALHDGGIQHWNALRNSFEPYSDVRAKRLAVNDTGVLWVVHPDGSLATGSKVKFNPLPGKARDIAVVGDTVAIIAVDGHVRRWQSQAGVWAALPGLSSSKAQAIAVVPGGGIWVALIDSTIIASTLIVAPDSHIREQNRADPVTASPISAPAAVAEVPRPTVNTPMTSRASRETPSQPATKPQSAGSVKAPSIAGTTPSGTANNTVTDKVAGAADASRGGADPATVTSSSPIIFVNTRQSARQLAIALDGTVFGLNDAGQLLLWNSSQKRFDDFPGQFVRIAVTPDGLPWGITAVGRVFRHDGKRWVQVADAVASDIAIGKDNTVLISDSSGNLYKTSATASYPRFTRIPGNGVLVAVAQDGSPWSVNADGYVQHCKTLPCTTFPQKAQSISIGPDGSLFIVSPQHQLLRLATGENKFELITTPGYSPSKVAVGPNGRPWVSTDDDTVLASAFFTQGTTDRTLALRTQTNTSGSGDTGTVVSNELSGFVFTKNMTFETVPSGLGSVSTISLATGVDGSVWAMANNPTAKFEKYNATLKRFVSTTTGLEGKIVYYYDVDSKGDIWATTSDGLVLRAHDRRIAATYTEFTYPYNLVVGPDDTVYLRDNDKIYYKTADSLSFKVFYTSPYGVAMYLAVGAAGDLWISETDGSSQIMKQWNGSEFEARPADNNPVARDLSASPDGTVYIIENITRLLRKWNGTNKSWDKVENSSYSGVRVDNDGRPWVVEGFATKDIKRARD